MISFFYYILLRNRYTSIMLVLTSVFQVVYSYELVRPAVTYSSYEIILNRSLLIICYFNA